MKYSYKDIDERIIKTKAALADAILELIREEKTTKVLDICQKANITAMTYYHHFNNRNELLDFAIKSQLQTILPIPEKLKPINIKHLMFYLIACFSKFMEENKQLIESSINLNKQKGYQNSYLHLVFLNIKYFVKEELKILCPRETLNLELWNNFICGSLANIFIQMIITQHCLKSNQV